MALFFHGETLRQFRIERQWSMDVLAGKLTASPHSVWRWETNRRCPRLRTIKQIAKVFGIKPEVLFNRNPEVNEK
jgi:transcriptional regulator with XRE-family HTH domain